MTPEHRPPNWLITMIKKASSSSSKPRKQAKQATQHRDTTGGNGCETYTSVSAIFLRSAIRHMSNIDRTHLAWHAVGSVMYMTFSACSNVEPVRPIANPAFGPSHKTTCMVACASSCISFVLLGHCSGLLSSGTDIYQL